MWNAPRSVRRLDLRRTSPPTPIGTPHVPSSVGTGPGLPSRATRRPFSLRSARPAFHARVTPSQVPLQRLGAIGVPATNGYQIASRHALAL